MRLTKKQKQNEKLLLRIEGDIDRLAEWEKRYLKNEILRIKEINDEMGQVFLVIHSDKNGRKTGHIPFHTRVEAELFVELVKKSCCRE